MRSLATRQSNLALSKYVADAIQVIKAAKYDIIILETSGIGQSDTEITEHSDVQLELLSKHEFRELWLQRPEVEANLLERTELKP